MATATTRPPPSGRPPETATPHVCVVVVTWNKRDDVLSLLAGLSRLDYPAARLDIVVVDNASTDGTAPAVRDGFCHVTLIENRENLGGAGGFNRGMRWVLSNRPQADYMWLLDNDVLVPPDALRGLVEVLEAHPDAAVCGSKILDLEYPHTLVEVGAFIDFRRGDIRRNLSRPNPKAGAWSVEDVDYVAACSLLVRTVSVQEVGLWHEELFIYWDDMEWGARFKACGHRVLANHASVVYHPSWAGRAADLSAIWRNYYRCRNSLCFFNHYSHGPSRRALLARMVLRFHLLGIHTGLRSESTLAQAFNRAVQDFFSGHYGKREMAFPDSDAFRRLNAPSPQAIWVFAPSASHLHRIRSILELLSSGPHGCAPSLIAPRQALESHGDLPPFAQVLTFETGVSEVLPFKERLRVFSFLRRKKPRLLVTPAPVPRFLALTGAPILRVDWRSGLPIALESMDWRALMKAPILALLHVFRALATPPGRFWTPPREGVSSHR